MECTSEKCKRNLRKRLHLINDLCRISSESSVFSDSETRLHPYKSQREKRKKDVSNSKHQYLTKLFERKKLRDKSLSKKLKTPFDRKINRTCWPIELKKITKIKQKPREKRLEKPTYRSLSRRKTPDLMFLEYREKSPEITCSELEFFDDDTFSIVYKCYSKNNYLYEQVTPQKLIEILQDPEFLKFGATINMIIKKLNMNWSPYKIVPFGQQNQRKRQVTYDLAFRSTGAPNLDSTQTLQQLKAEISVKLLCAIKLGIVVENNGYYKIADTFQDDKLSEENINTIWDWWFRRMKKMRR